MKLVKIILSISLIAILLCGCAVADNNVSTNSESSVVSANNGSQNNADDLLKTFISSKKYLEYTTEYTNESELSYAIVDINKDGTNELLIEADEGTGFNNTWMFVLDDENKITLVKKHYGFGTFRYLPNQNTFIVPPEFRPFIGASYYEFYALVQNKLELKFVIGADPDDESPQQEQYYYREADNKKEITRDEFSAYFDDAVSFEWIKIDN